MTETPEGSEDVFKADNFSLDSEEDDWGEDWESAFQAEDDLFSPEAAAGEAEEFFQEEKPGTSGTASRASEGTSTASAGEAADQGTKSTFLSPAALRLAALYDALPTLLSRTAELLATARTRLIGLPLYQQIILGVIAVGIPVTLVLLPGGGPDKPDQTRQSPALLVTAVAPQHPGARQDEAVSRPPAQSEETAGKPPEKTRRNWKFPRFFIPVVDQQHHTVAFVSIDITLIAALDRGEDLPEKKKPFVRDIIYQFFANRPYDELRRFSLARGEMSRKLRAWLHRQWPDGPIETIVFNRYHLT